MSFARRVQSALEARSLEAAREVATGADLEAVLTRHLLAVEAAAERHLLTSILLLDGDGRRLFHGAAPNLPKAFCEAVNGSEIGPSAGSCGTAAYLKRPVYVADIATDPLWADYRHLALPHGLRACWSTPILGAEGEVLGTFAIYHLAPCGPTSEELEAVRLITGHVADAIAAARPAPQAEGATPIPFNRAATPAPRPPAVSTWRRMQQIERCRHRAEVAEKAAAKGSPAVRREMADVARAWRELAEEYERLFYDAD